MSDKSESSVAAHLRCGGLFIHYVFIAKFGGKKNFKISEHLAKLQSERLIALFALQWSCLKMKNWTDNLAIAQKPQFWGRE